MGLEQSNPKRTVMSEDEKTVKEMGLSRRGVRKGSPLTKLWKQRLWGRDRGVSGLQRGKG